MKRLRSTRSSQAPATGDREEAGRDRQNDRYRYGKSRIFFAVAPADPVQADISCGKTLLAAINAMVTNQNVDQVSNFTTRPRIADYDHTSFTLRSLVFARGIRTLCPQLAVFRGAEEA